ncbi:hypothetical protein ACOBV9_18760 (plasmid) [Pseudoalteromonas espejiana]
MFAKSHHFGLATRAKKGKWAPKKGATGDCGACTILVGEEKTNSSGNPVWHYQNHEQLLAFIRQCPCKTHSNRRKAVTTGLYPTLDDLHPVQRALVSAMVRNAVCTWV